MVGLSDPPAPGVLETIHTFRTAGLWLVMLTGDQRLTAESVARALGLFEAGTTTLDDRDLEQLSDDKLRDVVGRTVAAAIEEGRVIFDNVHRFVFYLFICNLAEILVILGAGIAGLPAPLVPLQILWLNLLTDTFPACVATASTVGRTATSPSAMLSWCTRPNRPSSPFTWAAGARPRPSGVDGRSTPRWATRRSRA